MSKRTKRQHAMDPYNIEELVGQIARLRADLESQRQEITHLRAALLFYAERIVESEDGGMKARAALMGGDNGISAGDRLGNSARRARG